MELCLGLLGEKKTERGVRLGVSGGGEEDK